MQLWRGDYYAKQSDGNRLRQSRILAPRGIIYDSEGKELVNNLPGYDVVLQKQSSYKPETLQRLSNLLQMPVEEINAKIKASENFYEPIMLKNNLDQQMVTKIEEQRRYMPEVMLSVKPMLVMYFSKSSQPVLSAALAKYILSECMSALRMFSGPLMG